MARARRRSVLVLGSTGSIGRSALDVLRARAGLFTVVGLAANRRVDAFVEQVREFRPPAAALLDREAARTARRRLGKGVRTDIREGPDGVLSLLADPGADAALVGISGAAGLASTSEAVRRGMRVALANKESLVVAGPALLREARRTGAEILPVDSEHCAVAQALLAGKRAEVRRVLLTASGGALRDWPLALAAYNAGERRVTAALKSQGVSEYYQLVLPIETERYVFRILAAKLILEAPDHYGFDIAPEERYAPHSTDVITVPVTGSLGVRELAAAAGSFYREIRALNPAIMSDYLPKGRYEVRIPRGARKDVVARLPMLRRATPAVDVRRVKYRVKRGDTLQRIAERFDVSVEELRQWNRGLEGHRINAGDVLVIERSGRR